MSGSWDVVFAYTRAQAIADGLLVEIDREGIAKEAGFVVPVAVTSGVWALVEPTEEERDAWGQSVEGRLWDVLFMAHFAIQRQLDGGTAMYYNMLFRMQGREGFRNGAHTQQIKLVSGPGDHGEHVITIMLPDES